MGGWEGGVEGVEGGVFEPLGLIKESVSEGDRALNSCFLLLFLHLLPPFNQKSHINSWTVHL